ncbi:MAG: Fic family protein [Lactobacillaceae bacterium]|jgi:Fic family protein|nr:Fic family protein [Lactobacillaceae bacterium]
MLDYNILSNKLQQLNTYRPLSKVEVDELNRQMKIEHIWSSNAIEGNSLTRYETESVLANGMTISSKPIKDALEAIDLSEAYDFVKDLATNDTPLSMRDMRDINRLVTLKTTERPEIAGAIRDIEVWPNGFPKDTYAEPSQIPEKLAEFISWYNTTDDHPVLKATKAHAKFVTIHPFIDGNGRASRLLMNFTLMRAGYPIINIQPDVDARLYYMKSLQQYSQNHDINQFEQLIYNEVNTNLDERISILQNRELEISKAREETNLPPSFFDNSSQDDYSSPSF